jgi:hypothetical protein
VNITHLLRHASNQAANQAHYVYYRTACNYGKEYTIFPIADYL